MANTPLKAFTGELDAEPGSLKPFSGALDGESGGTASDLGKSLKVGAQRLPGMVTGLADLPFALAAGARPVTKAADALGEATGFQPGKWADETKFSPAYNEGKANIDKAWKDGSAGDIALSYLQNPAYTANQVVESVPSMVAGGLAGRALMGVGRVAAPLAKAGGVGPAAPGLLARTVGEKLAAPLAGGIGEGAVTAGQQMQQYQGDDQQKNAVASLGAGLGTTALGFGAGRLANKFGLETAETAIINAGRDGAVRAADNVPMSAKRRILSGMVSEGVLQELPQSVQEQMWQNYAEGKPLTEGIARAGVEGALAGAVMGAGANVSDGGANKRAKQQTIAERLAAEAEAANALTTSPGAADPNAPAGQAVTPPEAPDLQTTRGAGVPRSGMDFTREVDTSGLSLQDPAEVERARAATMDYQPGDATPQWETSLGAAAERQGLNMPPPEFDTGSLGIDTRTPSERMGINPSNGALSKAAAMAVDSGVSQEAQFLGATGRELQPRLTGPGVTNESNVIDVQGRVIEDRAIATPRRLTDQQDGMAARALGGNFAAQSPATRDAVPALGAPMNLRESRLGMGALKPEGANAQAAAQATPTPAPAIPTAGPAAVETAGPVATSPTTGVAREPSPDQAVQASPQPAQTAAATPAAEPAPGNTGAPAPAGTPEVRALTDGPAPTNPGAQSSPAPGAQGAAPSAAPAAGDRPKNWRTSMLGAKPVAKALGIDAKGKRLAQVVAEIDSADAARAGLEQNGSDLAAGQIDKEWSAFAPETGTLGIPRADMPQIKAEHRGALVNFLKARGIDSRADEVPANDLKPTQAEFSPAKVEKARAFQGGDRSILVSSDGYVVDGHHQWLAKRANGEPVKVIRLAAPIREVLTQTAEFPSVANAAGAQTTTGEQSDTASPDLRMADERSPGAGAAAQDGEGQQAGSPAPAVGDGQREGGDTAQPSPAVREDVPAAGEPGESASRVVPKAAGARPSPGPRPARAAAPRSTTRIEDFGETLHGARKMLYAEAYADGMAKAKALDTKAHPLSKTWPEPDYQKLLEGGAPLEAVSLVRALREAVPTKPQSSWKLKGWSAQVETLRGFSEDVLSGQQDPSAVRIKLNRDGMPRGVADKVALYEAMGHERSLKGIDVSVGRYSMYDRVEYNPPRTIWSVSREAKGAFGNWPRELAKGDTREEAIAAFKKRAAELLAEERAPTKGATFEIYGKRAGGAREFFIGKKIGRNVAELKTGFADIKAARQYLADNQTELEGLLEKYKAVPPVRNDQNAPRIGEDYRDGADVTPAQFQEAFGFRGVQFGNYVEGGRRQQDLNRAYDAMMDLAGVLNLPPKALSLGGRLGLAFGARGSGGTDAAAAHYERGNVVINLTKREGAGSLAHEWWHSLDNYFSRERGAGDTYMTLDSQSGSGVREEMRAAFRAVNAAINMTGMHERSRKLDDRKTKDYWTTKPEMSARAFESYVIAKLQDQNAGNDYLANVLPASAFALEGGYPYPTAGELPVIRGAFDAFFESVQTKEDAAGNVAMFSRNPEPMSPELARMLVAMGRPPGTATKDSVRSAVRELVGGLGTLSNTLGRVVVATAAEIKRDWEPLIGPTGMEASGEAGQAQGFYDPKTKTVFVIADHIRAGDEIGVVAHELMHKHGQAVLGEAGWNQLHTAIESWADADTGSVERRVYDEAVARVEASRPSDMNIPEYTTQELFPYAVQVALEMGIRPNGLAKPDTVSRWLAQVRSMLRQVWNKIAGQKGDFNSLDLVNLAFGIAQRENPAHVTELDAAMAERAQKAEDALKQISDQEDLFAQPKSNATTIQEIAAEHDPEIKVRTTDLDGETMYTLTMPDGTRATITSREPTKDEVFGMDSNTGRWISERPGEKAPPKGTRSDVWVDVSALKPGKLGSDVYSIASTFAHNTGRIFIGDPSGLSDIALRRRAEQMLSSALKFGTTDHIAPHPRQVTGDAALGVPPLRWVYGDHAGNIERLIDVNQQALENAFPEAKNLQYDLDTGNFIDARTGETVDPVRFDAGRERGLPARDGAGLVAGADGRGEAGLLGAPGAGWRTVARGAVFRSLLRQGDSSGAGRGDQRGAGPGTGRSEVVDGPVRQPDQRNPPSNSDIAGDRRPLDGLAAQRSRLASGDPLRRIFYSRAATTVATDYTPTQQAAAEKAFGAITKQTLAERAQAFRANMGTKLRQGLVDQFAPIKEVSQQAYMLARMSKGSDGAVEAALLYGKPFLRDGVTDVNMQDGGFANVLASLKGEHDRFFQWVAAQRAERLKAEGKENLLTDADIAALRSLNAGKMADGTVRMPLYAKALQELNAFNEASLKVAMESGLIDQAAYDLMRDQPYVPFYRLMEEGDMRGPRFSSGLTNQQAWKKLKGGTQQLNADLLQNTLLNWSHLYAAAARNRAALATMTEAENLGIAYQVPADTKGSTKVMRDGVAEHWMVEDPYLLEAISALNYTPGGIAKALAPFKRLLTFGVTVNPTFKIRNLIRDSLSAIAQSDLSYNPAENVAKGWKATSKGSQTYASMLASGGIIKFGTQENTNHLRGQIERLGGTMLDKQGWEKFTGQMRSLWETYEEFGDRTENVNRAALYERLRAKGLSHAEASFQARDLMDFSMSGKWEAVRFLTQTVPFLNARLQGLYKLGRAAKEDPRRFAAMAGAVSMASLALLAAYSDDEDWKKREDWDRDNFWWFKVGEIAFRIPKPFEVGAIGTVAERTAELMLSDEMTGKRFGQRISDMVFNTFAMDPTPQAIKPFLDVYANKDSFSGRAIEGMADERLRPQDRYNERTSEVARLLGSWGLPDPVRLAKGEYAGLSPKQIDFLLRGYFGWLATVSTTATDAIAKPLLGRGERPEARLRDAFLAGNFVESLPSGSSRYVTAMYEQARDVEQAWASYQAAIKSGDIEKAREIQQEEAPKLRSRMAVENAKSQIADLNARAKRIESDKFMSAQAKRAKLDEIETLRNRVAERVAVRN